MNTEPIQIVLVSNPFEPFKDLRRATGQQGQTIRDWLAFEFGDGFVEFDKPTVCQLNGEFIMRAEWDVRELQPGDVLAFVTLPGDVVTIVIAIVALVIAIVAVVMMPDPKIPNDQTTSPNSVYTLRGQTNQFRPNEPVEVIYGKVRRWPTFLSRPYSEYEGNQQYQYSLFCIGQGSYEIHSTQLDDTPTGDFDEIELEICPPGVDVTLVESSVFTALEVSNIELLGPNEDLYSGFSGPFTVNEFEFPIHRLAVDVSFPQGLYSLSDKGKLESESVELLFEYREIGAGGGAIGSWETLKSVTVTRSDNTPQRITYSKNVSAGRYEVRGKRISDKPESTRKATQARWESAKGYAKSVGNFGDVTVIAMKALATNNLNDQTAKSFNCFVTRKLKTWNAVDGWGPKVATRNPIWSFCDLFRASYGAKLTTEFLDMPTLAALAVIFEDRSDWFDWIFDGPLSVWEAAQMILRVGRSVPIPQGSLITAVRDRKQTLPAAVFNQANIVKGSLSKRLNMFDFQPFDALIVEYTDPDTWKTKEVTAVLPGRSGLNPDRLKLPGCTSRNRALREGFYIQSGRELQRKTLVFQTGLEGHIPSYLDLVSVTHDTVRVGQGGMILAYNPTTKVMTLSEQVTFGSDAIVHKIAIRGDDGAILGTPITVTPGSAPNKVVLNHDPDETLDFSENRVPQLYAFGVADLWAFLGKVTGIRPVYEKTVELTVTNYVSSTHDYDDETTVDAIPRRVIGNKSNPSVAWVTISAVPEVSDRIFVDWLPVPGAISYIIQTSYDGGTTWNPAGNYAAAPVQLSVNEGTLKVRIAPYALSGNVIYTVSNSFVVGSNISTPNAPIYSGTQTPFEGLTASAKWGAVSKANGYIAKVYLPGGLTALRTIEVGTALSVEYTRAQFVVDSPSVNSRDIEFRVTAFNAGGEGSAAVIVRSNPIPPAPTTLAVGSPTGTNYPATWAMTAIDDGREFRVYSSTTSGFPPGPANLVATVTSPAATLAAPTRPLYWRVAALDVWGEELALSTEAVIP